MPDPLGLIGSAGGAGPPIKPPAPGPGGDGASFKDVLLDNIKQVNDLQQDAHKAIEDLNAGRRDDVANVMIAKQKADIAFKALLAVRNKMMDAYQEIKDVRV